MSLVKVVEILEELKSDDTKKRVSALRSMDKIIDAMGVEKTKQQVLPFLKEYEDDEEEVLLELAAQFSLLAQFINDSPNGVLELIPYYYLLLGYEDFSVVNEGFKSFEGVLKTYSIAHESVMSLVKKLQALNSIKALCSSSRICTQFFAAIPAKNAADVARVLGDNAASRFCLVRKETATSLRHLLDEGHSQEPAAAALLKKLIKDPQESVRIAAVESLCFKPFATGYFMSNWHATLTPHFESKNWKVRVTVARNLPHVFASVNEAAQKALLPALLKLISDAEPEVSMQAIESIKGVAEMIEPGAINEKFFLAIRPIAAREDPEMKRLLAASIPDVAPLCTSEAAQEAFREVVAGLLKDESSDVKVSLLSNLAPLAKVYNNQQMVGSFLQPMLEMLNDKSWKVRRDALVALQNIAKGVGETFASNEKVLKVLRERLCDRVFEVRLMAVQTVRKLCAATSPEWAVKHGLPLVAAFSANPNYLYRVNYLWALVEIVGYLPPPVAVKEAESVAQLTKDSVANIRYQACIALFKLYRKLEDKSIEEKIVQTLKEFESDSDSDIQRLMNKQAGSSFRHVYARLIEQQAI